MDLLKSKNYLGRFVLSENMCEEKESTHGKLISQNEVVMSFLTLLNFIINWFINASFQIIHSIYSSQG